MSCGLVECSSNTDEGLGCNETGFTSAVTVHVDKVDLETLTQNNKGNADEDKDLSALAVLHENTNKNGGDLERNAKGVTGDVSIREYHR